MAASIAEYLGQRTDIEYPVIEVAKDGCACPFMNAMCSKVNRAKPMKPVCSVRDKNGNLWIVCAERLCSTKKTPINTYQQKILHSIAKIIFNDNNVDMNDILIKREVSMPGDIKLNPDGTIKYKKNGDIAYKNIRADYIMIHRNLNVKVILEMQGGGETSKTGSITRHINKWEQETNRTNKLLSKTSDAGLIVTNAWRRQQEQFIVKGNIATDSGGKVVFCVGKLLFDLLKTKVSSVNFQDLRNDNWTLCIIGFDEVLSDPISPGAIPYEISQSRIIFTKYSTFVHALITQGRAFKRMFEGKFQNLSGTSITI